MSESSLNTNFFKHHLQQLITYLGAECDVCLTITVYRFMFIDFLCKPRMMAN